MNDRIQLAEMMGYIKVDNPYPNMKYQCWQLNPNTENYSYILSDQQLPDPFTDANDDYAVLEWMREHHKMLFFGEHLRRLFLLRRDPTISDTDNYSFDLFDFIEDYKIGDYARAALKEIE